MSNISPFYSVYSRCSTYTNVPTGCYMVPDPKDPSCCEVPHCEIVVPSVPPTPGIVVPPMPQPGIITGNGKVPNLKGKTDITRSVDYTPAIKRIQEKTVSMPLLGTGTFSLAAFFLSIHLYMQSTLELRLTTNNVLSFLSQVKPNSK